MSYTEDKRVYELTQITTGFADNDRIPYQDMDVLDELRYITVGDLADYITENATNVGGTDTSNISDVVDPTTTAVPTSLTASGKAVYFSPAVSGGWGARLVLSWTANTESNFSNYILRYKVSSASVYNYVFVRSNQINLDGLIPGEEYNFGVCSVNKAGFQSAFSSDITETMATDSVAPNTPTGLSAVAGKYHAVLEWNDNTESDLGYYEVYQNIVDNSGTSVKVGETSKTTFVNGNLSTNTHYYWWVKAVDTSGNTSGFSTGDDATTGQIASDDVASLAAEKVLIDGIVYLSNWRGSADATKVNGAAVETGSITADKITVSTLSALAANMGSLTAGSIVITTGGTNKIWLNDSSDGGIAVGGLTKASAPFRVSASGAVVATSATVYGTIQSSDGTGQRVIIDGSNNQLDFYDSSNNLRTRISDDAGGYGNIASFGTSIVSGDYTFITGGKITMSTNAVSDFAIIVGYDNPRVNTLSIKGGGDLRTSGSINTLDVYMMDDVTIIGTSKNLTNITSISCSSTISGATTITCSSYIDSASYVDGAGGFKVNGTTVIDSSGIISTARIKAPSGANCLAYFASDGTLTADASFTTTEIGYLNGVTSSVQTQINGKVSTSTFNSHTGNATAHLGILSDFRGTGAAPNAVAAIGTYGWGIYTA